MKVYVAYKFKDENPETLRVNLEKLSRIIEESTGWKTYIFFRDAQNWKTGVMPVKEVVEKALEAVKHCDIILVEASEKARGAYLEAGYAKALGKKVVIVHKEGTEAVFLEAIADATIVYKDWDDLKERLKKIKIT